MGMDIYLFNPQNKCIVENDNDMLLHHSWDYWNIADSRFNCWIEIENPHFSDIQVYVMGESNLELGNEEVLKQYKETLEQRTQRASANVWAMTLTKEYAELILKHVRDYNGDAEIYFGDYERCLKDAQEVVDIFENRGFDYVYAYLSV